MVLDSGWMDPRGKQNSVASDVYRRLMYNFPRIEFTATLLYMRSPDGAAMQGWERGGGASEVDKCVR